MYPVKAASHEAPPPYSFPPPTGAPAAGGGAPWPQPFAQGAPPPYAQAAYGAPQAGFAYGAPAYGFPQQAPPYGAPFQPPTAVIYVDGGAGGAGGFASQDALNAASYADPRNWRCGHYW